MPMTNLGMTEGQRRIAVDRAGRPNADDVDEPSRRRFGRVDLNVNELECNGLVVDDLR